MQTSKMREPHDELIESRTSNLSHSDNRRNKRFQACVACRATKTKCLPSARYDSCQSCLKTSRPCIMPGPAKPRIKSAQKFSELEKKIEMLTNALTGTEQALQSGPDATTVQRVSAGARTPTASSSDSSPKTQGSSRMTQDTEFGNALLSQAFSSFAQSRLDVIDDGSVRRETAANLFDHWNTNMRCFMPFVVLGLDIDAEKLRNTRPMLFLAILAVASLSSYPILSAQLVTRLTYELSQQIFVQNTQSVDIILATLLYSQYYLQPKGSVSFAPSQLIHAAIAMSADLGLPAEAKSVLISSSSSGREAALAYLSEWYATSITATHLQRTPLIQYSTEFDEYAKVLQNENRPADRWLFSLVRLQQMIESASLLLDHAENKSEAAFDEPGTQYKMSMLRQRLDAWEQDLPKDVDNRLKQYGRHTAYLFIHALAIRCYVRKIAIRKQANDTSRSNQEDELMGLTPLHFDCLTKCLASVKASFDIYLSFDLSLARCLPNSYLHWNISAAVLLIKLGHFGEVLTRLGQPTTTNDASTSQPAFQTTLIYYLDAVAAKMDQVSQDGYLPQAKPYVTVLRKLKPYYLQKRNVCINSQGDAVVVDDQNAPIDTSSHSHNPNTASRPGHRRFASGNAPMQAHIGATLDQNLPFPKHQSQSSTAGLSHSGWTPGSDFSPGPLQTPVFSGAYGDQLGNSSTTMTAAYDPHTYANTDWDALTLDPEAVQQLDSYMWAEEDTAWMQLLL